MKFKAHEPPRQKTYLYQNCLPHLNLSVCIYPKLNTLQQLAYFVSSRTKSEFERERRAARITCVRESHQLEVRADLRKHSTHFTSSGRVGPSTCSIWNAQSITIATNRAASSEKNRPGQTLSFVRQESSSIGRYTNRRPYPNPIEGSGRFLFGGPKNRSGR